MFRIKIIMQLKSIKFNAACISRISIFSRTICTRNERQRSHWTTLIHTATATHCRARVRFSGSAASRARCPGPGTSCLLQVAADVALRADVAWSRVASRLQRTNFGFICNFTLAVSLKRIERRGRGSAIWRYLWQSIIRRNHWPH